MESSRENQRTIANDTNYHNQCTKTNKQTHSVEIPPHSVFGSMNILVEATLEAHLGDIPQLNTFDIELGELLNFNFNK